MRILVASLLCFGLIAPVFAEIKDGKIAKDDGEESAIHVDPQGQPERGRGQEVLIWQEGDVWKIRTYSARKQITTFNGTIRLLGGGKVKQIAAIAGMEPPGGGKRRQRTQDIGQVSRDKKSIEFQFRTAGKGEDGFDFQVTKGTKEVEFSILVGGFAHPEKIRIGGNGQVAPSATFKLAAAPPADDEEEDE